MTPADYAWAKAVKERDGFMCVICKSNERLNSHHILPRELHDTKLDISNGITLCCSHHMFSREISAHNNPLAFFVWMCANRPDQIKYLMGLCEL
jgi:predicted restriction endonuclease